MPTIAETLPTTRLQATAYEGDVQVNVSKRHPLHERLSEGGVVRFEPSLTRADEGVMLGFIVTFGASADAADARAHRMKHLSTNDQHVLIWPRDLARATGLTCHAEANAVEVMMSDPGNDDRFEVQLDPPLKLPTAEIRAGSDEGTRTRLDKGGGEAHDRYRLRFPTRFNETHDFEAGSPVGVSITAGDDGLAVVLTPGADENAPLTRSLQYEQPQARSSAGNVTTTDQYSVNVPMVVVQFALSGNTDVKLHADGERILLTTF